MHESSWRPMGMPTAAARAPKHSMRDDRRSQDFILGTLSRRNANTHSMGQSLGVLGSSWPSHITVF